MSNKLHKNLLYIWYVIVLQEITVARNNSVLFVMNSISITLYLKTVLYNICGYIFSIIFLFIRKC